MGDMSNVFDWTFFWGVFSFFLKTVAPFLMLIIAIFAVGWLLKMVVGAVKSK